MLAQPGEKHQVRTRDFESRSKDGDDSGIPEELSAEMLYRELDQMPHLIFKPLPEREVALPLIIDQ